MKGRDALQWLDARSASDDSQSRFLLPRQVHRASETRWESFKDSALCSPRFLEFLPFFLPPLPLSSPHLPLPLLPSPHVLCSSILSLTFNSHAYESCSASVCQTTSCRLSLPVMRRPRLQTQEVCISSHHPYSHCKEQLGCFKLHPPRSTVSLKWETPTQLHEGVPAMRGSLSFRWLEETIWSFSTKQNLYLSKREKNKQWNSKNGPLCWAARSSFSNFRLYCRRRRNGSRMLSRGSKVIKLANADKTHLLD